MKCNETFDPKEVTFKHDICLIKLDHSVSTTPVPMGCDPRQRPTQTLYKETYIIGLDSQLIRSSTYIEHKLQVRNDQVYFPDNLCCKKVDRKDFCVYPGNENNPTEGDSGKLSSFLITFLSFSSKLHFYIEIL